MSLNNSALLRWFYHVPPYLPLGALERTPGSTSVRGSRRMRGSPGEECVIVPLFMDRRVFVLGGGPSLRGVDVGRLKGECVVAVNNSYLLAPFAQVLVFTDHHWYLWHRLRGEFVSFAGMVVTCDEECAVIKANDERDVALKRCANPCPTPCGPQLREQMLILRNDGPFGLSLDRENPGLCTGYNSGYAAINLAVLLGSKEIYLLGYDMKYADSAERLEDGRTVHKLRTHWHEGHPESPDYDHQTPSPRIFREVMIPEFRKLPPLLEPLGVNIVNLSPDSALDAFPRGNITDVLGS